MACKILPLKLKLQRQAMESRSAEAWSGEWRSPVHQRGSHFTVFCISPLYWLCENNNHGAIHASRCRSSHSRAKHISPAHKKILGTALSSSDAHAQSRNLGGHHPLSTNKESTHIYTCFSCQRLTDSSIIQVLHIHNVAPPISLRTLSRLTSTRRLHSLPHPPRRETRRRWQWPQCTRCTTLSMPKKRIQLVVRLRHWLHPGTDAEEK